MQVSDRTISVTTSTLSTLIDELGTECQNVITLIHQLQLPNLSDRQKAEILADFLSAAIHLNVCCWLEGFSVAVSIFSKVVIVGFIAARGRTKTANPKQETARLQMMAARAALTNIFTIYLIALFIK